MLFVLTLVVALKCTMTGIPLLNDVKLMCDDLFEPVREHFGVPAPAQLLDGAKFSTDRQTGIAGKLFALRPVSFAQYKTMKKNGQKLMKDYVHYITENKDTLLEKIVAFVTRPEDRTMWMVVNRLPDVIPAAKIYELYGYRRSAGMGFYPRSDANFDHAREVLTVSSGGPYDRASQGARDAITRPLAKDTAFLKAQEATGYNLLVGKVSAKKVRVCTAETCANPWCNSDRSICLDLHGHEDPTVQGIGEYECVDAPKAGHRCDIAINLHTGEPGVAELTMTCYYLTDFLARQGSSSSTDPIKLLHYLELGPNGKLAAEDSRFALPNFHAAPISKGWYPSEPWEGVGTCRSVPHGPDESPKHGPDRLWVHAGLNHWNLGGEYALVQKLGSAGGHVYRQKNATGYWSSPSGMWRAEPEWGWSAFLFRDPSMEWRIVLADVGANPEQLVKEEPVVRQVGASGAQAWPKEGTQWRDDSGEIGLTVTAKYASHLDAVRKAWQSSPSAFYVQLPSGITANPNSQEMKRQLYQKMEWLQHQASVRGVPNYRGPQGYQNSWVTGPSYRFWLYLAASGRWALTEEVERMADINSHEQPGFARSFSVQGETAAWPDEVDWDAWSKSSKEYAADPELLVYLWHYEAENPMLGFPVNRAPADLPKPK